MALTPGAEAAQRTLSVVVGFDPGLAAAGLAIINPRALRCYRAWTVRTSPAQTLPARLAEIEAHLRAALYDYFAEASLLAIEDQHQTFHAMLRAGRSNPNAGRLERVVGIAHGLARARGIEVVMVTPQQVRARLGLHMAAKKKQIARAVRMQLSGVPAGISNHAIDAAGIALAGARQHHGQGVTARREIA